MSEATSGVPPRLRFGVPKLSLRPIFNGAGSAGPRRLALAGAVIIGTAGVIAVVVLAGHDDPIVSHDASIVQLDPLPGGLHTTPEQDALAQVSIDQQAQGALNKGTSYTPPMAPSQPARAVSQPEEDEPAIVPSPIAPQPPAARPTRQARSALPDFRTTFAIPAASAPATPEIRATPIAATAADQGQAQQGYSRQINDMFSQWGGRAPRTDVLLPPLDNGPDASSAPSLARPAPATRTYAPDAASAVPVAVRSADAVDILIPAGRGVYAHPILALSSDETSPVVLQADSGPVAGDRMIGTFSKEANRLIIHISTIVHHGENLSVDGVVTAPDTMEASVASKVDEHYVARFVLPAAAAFVAGLGQAIQQTSNSVSVLSPFGGATTSTHLNLQQQLGVAAGTAASQLSSTLGQEAPKGPTISLEANVAVGVMFLSNVTAHQAR